MAENFPLQDYLEMSFDPNTIEHLGVQMYYTLPPVLAELVANSYDADANLVTVSLTDIGDKEIVIKDDGHGMTFDELNEKFLKIGRNRRAVDGVSPIKKRPVIGKKGLGKLAFFGIAEEIIVETMKDGERSKFSMDIQEIKKQKDGHYRPSVIEKRLKASGANGTKVILKRLKRKSAFDLEDISVSLSRFFTVFDEKDFKVVVSHNQQKEIILTNELKYKSISALMTKTAPFLDLNKDYPDRTSISGKILVSKDNAVPMIMRGVALFSRGKLVNDYSFYDIKATSYGYSYITGILDVSFIDTWGKEVIATNRRSLNWEDEDTKPLKTHLEEVITYIFNEQRKVRKEQKKKAVLDKVGIDVDEWVEALPSHERKLATKLIGDILESDGIETDKAADLVEYVKDSFQFETFKQMAGELESIKEINSEDILSLLKEWKVIEAREFYKLSLVRVEAIKQFEIYIVNNAKEVPTLHSFLKSFSWLLDPRIIEFEDEVAFSKLLKEKYPDGDQTLENDRRIDFLCTTLGNTLFIIELKRPHSVVNEKVLSQANAYSTFIKKHLGTDPYSPKQVITYIVCGQQSSNDEVKNLVEVHQKAGAIYVKTYSELLTSAQKYHKEFISKYEEMRISKK